MAAGWDGWDTVRRRPGARDVKLGDEVPSTGVKVGARFGPSHGMDRQVGFCGVGDKRVGGHGRLMVVC